MKARKIKGLFKLLRFELPFAAGICVVLGQSLASGKIASVQITAIGFFSVFFTSAAILVLNDYFDVETDKINAPHRPIAANVVTKTEALAFAIILFIAGLILGYFISIPALICTAALSLIGFLYNRGFKKYGVYGNLMVSFSVGMTFIYGGITVGIPFDKAVWFFAIIASLIDLGEEIAADAMDAEGDKLIESHSIAIKYGKSTALKISGLIFGTVILLTIIPFVTGWFKLVYFLPFSLMDVAIGYSTIRLIRPEEREVRKLIRVIYLSGTIGLLIFLIMRVAGL
ncbi:MAG: UbiA family prenyltransferase [bacterium]